MPRFPRHALALLLSIPALILISSAQDVSSHPPATPCNPCVLMYGGDFDPQGPNANALQNELTTSVVAGATVYVPFVVPAGQTWTVNELFTKSLSYTSVIDPQKAIWSIHSGMSAGSQGTVVADGAAPATYSLTKGGGFGMNEYLLVATINPPVTLSAGEYWMSVVPECKNPIDRACAAAAYFMPDVEDSPRHHARGDQPNDDAFYDAGDFGYFFSPTWGSTGACQGTGCDRFAAGVAGTVSEQ